jgi:arylformamidase
MQVIDLSVTINVNTPVYPGDPKPKIEPAGILTKDGYADHSISLGTHVGTHIDAPMHMLEGGKGLNDIPPDQFIGQGHYVKINGEFSLETIKNAHVQAGEIVLFHTGMAEKYHDPSYFENYPAMSEEIAEYLVAQKVKMIGLDTGSADNTDGFPIHKTLLGGDVLIIENLTNLEVLADKNFKVYALPLKLEVDGSPARVVAVIQ